MKMEPHWTEKPSGKNSLRLLGQMMKIENYGILLPAHQNLITGGTLETVKTQTPEEIIPKIVEGMLKVKKQMHRIAVR